MNSDQDVLDLVARYAPTSVTVQMEWDEARSGEVLAAIVGDVGGHPQASDEIPLRFVPAQDGRRRARWSRALPMAASAAVLVVALGAIALLLRTGGSRSFSGGGPPFDPPAALSTHAIDDGEYSYRALQQIDIDATGQAIPDGPNAMTMRDYVAPNGDVVSFRPGQQPSCLRSANDGEGDLADPSRAFFAGLPTDPEALAGYLRSHVSGSSSHDEAVFVAVGDVLREADGLASPRLRAAFVAVLSRTPGVTLHEDTRDYLGRRAIRLDFVNQAIRPGEVHSLYFAPDTFQLLEEQFSENGAPNTYAGPSPDYNATAPAGVDPQQLTGPGYVEIMTEEKVVDEVPACTSS